MEMNDGQRAAARAAANKAVSDWAEPQIRNASMFTRGAYEAFLSAHATELANAMVEAVGSAILGPMEEPAPDPPKQE